MPDIQPSFSVQVPSNPIPRPTTRESSNQDPRTVQTGIQSNAELHAAARAAKSACHRLLHTLSQADNGVLRSDPMPSPRPIRYISLRDYFRARDERRERNVVRIIKNTDMSSRARARLYPRAFETGGILRRQYWYLKDSGKLTNEEWRRVAPRRQSGRIRR